jgi:HAD superfamily hydrolase (TIGR01509 family)
MQWELPGIVATGAGQAAGFTALPWVRAAFLDQAGIDPHPGTLNVTLAGGAAVDAWARIRAAGGSVLEAGDAGSCDAELWPVTLAAGTTTAAAGPGALAVPAAIVVPRVPGYPPDRLELVSPVALRALLGLADGAAVTVCAAAPPPALAAVVFDVDGTLVDSVGAYHEAAVRAAAPHGYTVDAAMVRLALDGDVPFWPLVVGERAGDSALLAALRDATRQVWPDVLREHVRAFAGAREILQDLSARGLRLGICTASGGETFAALQEAGLLDFFAVVVTARDVTHRKPDPEGLLRCLEGLGVAPAQAAYVGDTAVDVRASRAAGMWPVGVLTGAGDGTTLASAGAGRLVRDLRSIPRVLTGFLPP